MISLILKKKLNSNIFKPIFNTNNIYLKKCIDILIISKLPLNSINSKKS